MDTEIELKFFVSEQDVIEKITTFLTQQQLPFAHKETSLTNCYFDTKELALRKLDMGLRIRTCADYKEQTIKTAGNIIGGLHQRPEYNVEIAENIPNLSLFPEKIWPENIELNALQQQLIPLFSTNFIRHTWLIDYSPSTKIELAYDLGVIKSNDSTDNISEIELELLTGNTKDILTLSKLLAEHVALLPGNKSKAARGYALYHQTKIMPNITPLELVPVTEQYDLGESFKAGLQFGLNRLQEMVNAYVAEPSFDYLSKITELLALMRHGYWLYQEYLPEHMQQQRDELSYFIKQLAWVDTATHFQELTDKTGNYRHKLEFSAELVEQIKFERNQFPSVDEVIAIFTSTRFNQLQIALLEFVLSAEKLLVDGVSLVDFAEQKLEQNLVELRAGIAANNKLTVAQYLGQYKLLIRSLLTGSWFGNLYNEQQRLEFRHPWLDLKQGIAELQTLDIIQQHLKSVDMDITKLDRWVNNKIENLLVALEHSRLNALSIAPYWH
jgi:triphosphatase